MKNSNDKNTFKFYLITLAIAGFGIIVSLMLKPSGYEDVDIKNLIMFESIISVFWCIICFAKTTHTVYKYDLGIKALVISNMLSMVGLFVLLVLSKMFNYTIIPSFPITYLVSGIYLYIKAMNKK